MFINNYINNYIKIFKINFNKKKLIFNTNN